MRTVPPERGTNQESLWSMMTAKVTFHPNFLILTTSKMKLMKRVHPKQMKKNNSIFFMTTNVIFVKQTPKLSDIIV